MHSTALQNCHLFFQCYESFLSSLESVAIVDIGSQNINGSLKDVTPPSYKYIGVDFAEGKGVDVILTDPYKLPFDDNSIDVVVSSSCFEHSEMFWLVYLEVMRVLKPTGIFYLNVPFNQRYHRYPVDCWRFYPDSGSALINWGKRNGYDSTLLESYISKQGVEGLNDYVGVFLKDKNFASQIKMRIVDNHPGFFDGWRSDHAELLNPSSTTEDKLNIIKLKALIRP